MEPMSLKARAFVDATVLIGLAVFTFGLLHWQYSNPIRLLGYLLLALVASGLKVSLPGVKSTMSLICVFLMIAILELSLPETLLLSCVGTLMQCYWHAKMRPKPVQVFFSIASMTTAVSAAYFVYHSRLAELLGHSLPLMLLAAASTLFIANTVPVAYVVSLTENKPLRKVWSECFLWSFHYYLVGAAIAGIVSICNRYAGEQTWFLVIPVVYSIYRSCRLYMSRLEAEKKHLQDMAGLHLRTIEALALAIEAKDLMTHDHLCRVRIYAEEVGKALSLAGGQLEALRAAAVLHDIGKLAVPEHIISKPGKLTPEEFEKMKIHPVVGAEILEQVQFPYPVAPIVRAHHEKWNGTGYPCGIRGEEIPIGARILAAVDCLDALASDRQYRRALPLDQAMEVVTTEAGKSFDPKVVEVLKAHYTEFEQMAHARQIERIRLSTGLKIENGEAPAAGFEASRKDSSSGAQANSTDFLCSIAAARQEVQTLFELSQTLGNSLSLNETLSVLCLRLKRMIPYDSVAIYLRKDDRLIPEYVCGENFRLFASLQIPIGEGLSGWVAENCKPILNGNPSVEPGYLNDPTKFSTLRSALAAPLEGVSGVVGVIALYHAGSDAFTKDHLRILLAVCSKAALSIENALKYRVAESSATTDYLTGLPNSRSLFLHLDHELARCKREKTSVSVFVCDLDGFKQINDQFGHMEGNRVLRLLGAKLRETCREYDYVARMGGDEFVFVVPGLKPAALREMIGRLDAIAAQVGREVYGENLLSLSVGHASYPGDGANAEELLAEADRRMYGAKQRHHAILGNNKVLPLAFNCQVTKLN